MQRANLVRLFRGRKKGSSDQKGAKPIETFDPKYELGIRAHPPTIAEGPPRPIELVKPAVPWPAFMKPVYVLSIRRWRMDKFVARMRPWMLYMRRFPCTDGRFVDTSQWIRQKKLLPHVGLSMGQVGCAASHIGVWSKIAKSSHPHATILEDDVAINWQTNGAEVVDRINQAVEELEANQVEWDILWWGHGPWADGKNPKVGNLKHWRALGSKCPGFFAYTIKKSFATHLAGLAWPVRSAIDIWVHSVTKKNFKGYVLDPKLCFVVPGPSETTRMQP